MATTTTRSVPASGSSGAKAADGSAAGEKKSKKKLIIMGVVGVLVVGVGAKETVLKPKVSAAAAAEAKKKAPPVYGPIVALDEQTLNLADGHYLKLKVVIQLKKTAKAKTATDGAITPEMTNAAQDVLDVYSSYTQAQLTGTAAQEKVKQVLQAKLAPIYPEEIDSVLTPEFLMSS